MTLARNAAVSLGHVLLAAVPLAAQEAVADEGPAFTVRTSLKASLLLSRLPDAPELFPERDQAITYWRLRLEPQARLGPTVTLGAAFEQRLRLFSTAPETTGPGVLPSEGRAPYRVRQLDWLLARSSGSSWRQEIDRAYVAMHLSGLELTAGRQAIGWGRGMIFGAVDLFSPFTPLEADREWRRGIDALRADVKLTDRASLDLVAAFGESLDASAFAGRLRGYAGNADLEVAVGRRGGDFFAGLAGSTALGQAAAHGELALFHTPPAPPGSGTRRQVVKAVVGASYRFPLATGLLVYAEYHYSGFGARSAGDIVALLADAAFQDRYLRGDTQILGRHALGVAGSLELSPELALGIQAFHSSADGSGLLVPSVTATFGDKVSVVAIGHLPYGRGPRGGVLRSEFGAAPRSLFVQVRIYR